MLKLLFVLVLLGIAAIVGALLWGLYLKPKLRRRYERNLQRMKRRH